MVVEVPSLWDKAGIVVIGMHGSDVARTLHSVASLTVLVRGAGPGTLPSLGGAGKVLSSRASRSSSMVK